MARIDSALWKLRDALTARQESGQAGSQSAIVSRIEKDGTAYVRFPGSDSETALQPSTTEMRAGDEVPVLIRDGKAYAYEGNGTTPSVGGEQVSRMLGPVASEAERASAAAAIASAAASQAVEDARIANDAATSATDSASRAERGLEDVEKVIGTVNWIAEHGRYVNQAGQTFDAEKIYYTRSGDGTSQSPYVYTVVAEPKAADIATYYVLEIDESLQNYIASHLWLDNYGLNLTVDSASGYRLHQGTVDGTYTFGQYIVYRDPSTGVDSVCAEFTASGMEIYSGGKLRQRTAADGSHYYAGDGTTKVLSVGAGKRYGRDSALLTFLGETMLNTDDAGMTIETYASGSWSNRTTIDLLAYGTNFNSKIIVDSSGRITLAVDRLSDNTGPGITIDGTGLSTSFHGHAIFDGEVRFNEEVKMVSSLVFSSMANASTSADFFATGIQAFANGGRLRYKGLADMKSWLGLNSLFKVVTSAPSAEMTLASGALDTGTVCNFTGTDGYTLAAVVSVQASSKSVAVTNFWKRSNTQMGISTHNPSSSAKTFTVSVTALFVKSAFVG